MDEVAQHHHLPHDQCIEKDCTDRAVKGEEYCHDHFPHDSVCGPQDGDFHCRIDDDSCRDRQRENAIPW